MVDRNKSSCGSWALGRQCFETLDIARGAFYGVGFGGQ